MKSRIVGSALALAVVGGLGSVARAAAEAVLQWTPTAGQDVYSSGQGGEFAAKVTGLPAGAVANQSAATYVNYYGVASPNNPSGTAVFQTFCIQEGVNDVTFNPGTPYYASIVTSLSAGPGSVKNGVGYLYNQFWNGKLLYYNFTGDGVTTGGIAGGLTRTQTAGALQSAIWALEGDNGSVDTGDATDSKNSAALAGAESEAQATSAAQELLANYYFNLGMTNTNVATNVEILELNTINSDGSVGAPAQAQLVEVVPLPAALPIGLTMLAGMAVIRKLRRRA